MFFWMPKMTHPPRRMRDEFIRALVPEMERNDRIFFLCADFGSPQLDVLAAATPDRFINVGIAEQNLVNVATGLALEGCTVFAYAIAPFITMRCYEQVRVNLALTGSLRRLAVTLIGVGAGLSYDVSGPTHQALEDISIMRTLPRMQIGSPCDCPSTVRLLQLSLAEPRVRYLRLDGKALPDVYTEAQAPSADRGFFLLRPGQDVCLVATGYMTHRALAAAEILAGEGLNAAVMDLFLLSDEIESALREALAPFRVVVTIEEGFTCRAGLDSLVRTALGNLEAPPKVISLGLPFQYRFHVGKRDALLDRAGLSAPAIAEAARSAARNHGSAS